MRRNVEVTVLLLTGHGKVLKLCVRADDKVVQAAQGACLYIHIIGSPTLIGGIRMQVSCDHSVGRAGG